MVVNLGPVSIMKANDNDIHVSATLPASSFGTACFIMTSCHYLPLNADTALFCCNQPFTS